MSHFVVFLKLPNNNNYDLPLPFYKRKLSSIFYSVTHEK